MATLVPGHTLCSSRAQLQRRQQPAIACVQRAPLRAGVHTSYNTALSTASSSLLMGQRRLARLLPPRAEASDAEAGAANSAESGAGVSRLTDSDAMGAEAFVEGAQPAASPVRDCNSLRKG